MTERLRFLSGDINWLQYGGKWISKKHNNGEFDYWYVVELINMKDATGDEGIGKYNLSIRVVAPSEIPPEMLHSDTESYGYDKENYKEFPIEMTIEVIHGCGRGAYLWNGSGNNFKTLWKEAHEELSRIEMLFGFYMDKPENRLGATGWDFIKGDIMRPLREYKESTT